MKLVASVLAWMIALSFSLSTAAVSIEQLQNDGQIKLQYNIVTATAAGSAVVQYQPVTLEIEVATTRWFARGTRVENVDIEGALLYRGASSSANSSRNVDGESWAVQQRRLVIYPQQSGSLTIPPIDIFISVNTENNKAVEGTLTLESRTIEVTVPKVMQGRSDWLATTGLKIEESYAGLKHDYQPGDAITRSITMTIEGAPAMMLPPVVVPAIEGLAIYSMQAVVEDFSNRGVLLGTRKQQVVYTIEQAGSYQLPAYQFYWWDLANQQQQKIELPALTLDAGGAVTVVRSVTNKKLLRDDGQQLGFLMTLFALLCLCGLLWMFAAPVLRKQIKQRQQRRHDQQIFLQAVKNADALQAVQYLYRLIEAQPQQQVVTLETFFCTDKNCVKQIGRLKCWAYAKGESISGDDAQCLLNFINKKTATVWPWQRDIQLSLNN